MTTKELAELLNLTKPTVVKAIKELDIERKKVGNRYVINNEDAIRVIKQLRPQDYEQLLEKIEILENRDSKSEKNEKGENEKNATNENGNKNFEKEKGKNENSADKMLIEMLQKALEDKENTIRSQQSTIDNLIKANTALTATVAMLEDKSKEPVVVDEEPVKKKWWQRFFN